MYQKIIILGRFVEDPQAFSYGQGGQGARLRIAADSGRDQTTYFDGVAFAKNAENILKFFKKGRPIMIEGRMENNNREREVNGVTMTNYGMNLVVERWSFAGDSAGQNTGGQQQSQPQQTQQRPQQGGYQQQSGGYQQQPNNQQQQQQGNDFSDFSGFGGGEDDFPF